MADSNYKLKRTGLLYDPLMLNFHCEWDPNYPEKPDRILKPYERCKFYGLTEKCIFIPGRFGTDEEIETCHTKRVRELMKSCEGMNSDELKHLATLYDSMFFHQNSDQSARFALGSSLELLDNIMTNKVDNGFAIIRPPGHHAMHDEPNGYCYYNNAAIVARKAIQKYKLKRILIVDWDVHHGQASQFEFYNDPRVLYFSMHRYDFGKFWPNLRQSDFDYIGEKEGAGYNINIPLNKIGFGDSEYLTAFFNLLLPVAYEFEPELIIVSSGYDAAIGCFEGKMRVTPAAYAHMLNALSCFSNSKLCVLLEGGYCIKSLSEGVALSVRALLGYPTPRIEDLKRPDPVFVQTVLNTISILRPYWKCLQGLNDTNSINLKDYLIKWDEDYRKDIKFYDFDNRPSQFEIVGFYPLWPEEDNIRLDMEIDKLIETTDLSVPESRSCLVANENHSRLLKELDKNVKILPLNQNNPLWLAIEMLALKKFTNGIALIQSSEKPVIEEFIKNSHHSLKSFSRFKKALIISLNGQVVPEESLLKENESSILHVSIESNASKDKVTKLRNNINLSIENLDEAGYITTFLRVILPIAYQFNPDLVFVNVDQKLANEKNKLSQNGFLQIFKLLNALANGNLILGFEIKDEHELLNLKDLIENSAALLIGENCNSLKSLSASEGSKVSIKKYAKELNESWPVFQYNENLPNY